MSCADVVVVGRSSSSSSSIECNATAQRDGDVQDAKEAIALNYKVNILRVSEMLQLHDCSLVCCSRAV